MVTRRRYARVGTKESETSGVLVERDRRTETVRITGWYYNSVGIEPVTMSMREFLRGLGFRGVILDFVPATEAPS